MQIHLLPFLFYDHEGPYVVHDARLTSDNQRIFFRQGDLDGACGPYALMSALMISGVIEKNCDARRLWSETLLDKRTNWHKEMMVNGKSSPRIIEGTTEKELPRMLDAIQKIIKPKQAVRGASLSKGNNEGLMQEVIDHLNNHQLPVILGLEWGKNSGHWVTVVGYQTYDRAGSKETQTDLDNADALLVLDPGAPVPRLCAWNGMLETFREHKKKLPFRYFDSNSSAECRVADSMALFSV